MKLTAEVQDVLQRCRVDGQRLVLPEQLVALELLVLRGGWEVVP